MDILQYPFDGALILQKKRAIKKELLAKPGLIDKKIAILSGSTVGELAPVLEIFLLNAGIRPTFYQGGFGLFYEDAIFGLQNIANFLPDVVYVHTSARNLQFWPTCADSPEEAETKAKNQFAHFESVWQALQKLGCPIVQNNFEEPGFRNFGNMDAWDLRGRTAFVRGLNQKMASYAKDNNNFFIHDFAWLAATHGTDTFCPNLAWYAYKYALAPSHIPALAHSLAGLIKSFFGLVKKTLVADLDNTLWGGIIGEVGAEGVEISSESPEGMAFADFQRYLAGLASRGILLNVASKNQKDTALSGFKRGDSPLAPEDFLCFEANWEPKSHSIAQMANTLNLGLDSFVFADDNPAEREEVGLALPAVVAVPINQPEESIALLDKGAYFEVSSLSADDIKRSGMYRQNALRQNDAFSYKDYDDYLKNLQMKANISPFAPGQIERITQLINKTNQFNLTTLRYTAAQVQQCAANTGQYITLAANLADKFGDNGITSAIIARLENKVLNIELWVMSCRVFKRKLEYAMFDSLLKKAKDMGAHTITGRFLPTAKNLLVKDFYATLGFTGLKQTPQESLFSYAIPKKYTNLNKVIKVENTWTEPE